jgi:Ca-activated chloride channel family protein
MRLRDPYFLWLLLIWVPLVWIYLRREKGRQPAVRFSDLSVIKQMPISPLTRLRHVPFILRCIGIGLLVVALARPQRGHSEQEIVTHGVDIMLVMDISRSMEGLDFQPKNRLFVSKETIKEFVRQRANDRMGLVIFAGRAFTKCPLTLDQNVLTQFLDGISFDDIQDDGTAIGTAIATAANRLKDSNAKSRIMILSTDGANNRGEIAPITAAQAAKELGIKIYTIGVGKEGEVPYPAVQVNPFTGQRQTVVQMVKSELDEKLLQEIADQTNGRFFRASDSKQLAEIYATINKLEKSEIKMKTYTTFTEHFFVWLLAGFCMLMAELILANTRFRRIP